MKLNVCWLMDQRPGHLTKIRGVLKALGCHRELSVQEIPVIWKPRFLRTLVPHLPGISAGVCLQHPVKAPIDLVISAGGATEWANAKLARSLSVPNIFLGSLRSCGENEFTVLPRIEPGQAPQILVMDIIPSEIDVGMVKAASEAELGHLRGRYWTVLIGGDGSGCVWTAADHAAQADRFIGEAVAAGVKLIVTSSRRTGVSAERIWEQRLGQSDRLALGVWYSRKETEQQPRLAALLGKAERVIITEDSASMINEAVATGKPVATIAPAASGVDALQDGMLVQFEAAKRIVRLRAAGLRLSSIPDDHWLPMQSGWHASFGSELLKRIQPLLKKNP